MPQTTIGQYETTKTLRQGPNSKTFLARNSSGVFVLRTFSASAFPPGYSLEDGLSWQKGLKHPHILGILDGGTYGRSGIFVVRKYLYRHIETSLSDLQVKDLVAAIDFLHSNARIHGSLRPSNILLEDDQIQIGDMRLGSLGIATRAEEVRFTAPELLNGGAPTPEGDYYSLGAILYRSCSGRNPFEDSHLHSLRAKYLHATIPSLRHIAEIPRQLSDAVDGLLSRDPKRRVAAFKMLRALLDCRLLPPSETPFVGRSDTLSFLKEFLASGTENKLQVLVLDGEAGIGKTRLIEELRFRCSLRGIRIFQGHCGSGTGLEPVLDFVRVLLRDKGLGGSAHPLNFEPIWGAMLNDQGDKEPALSAYPIERVVHDLIGAMSALSRTQTIRLSIDDLEKADAAITGFLRQLCFRASELNLRLLLACRDTTGMKVIEQMKGCLGGDMHQFSLKGLPPGESEELAKFFTPYRVRQLAMSRESFGNPLCLLEQAKGTAPSSWSPEFIRDMKQQSMDEGRGEAIRIAESVAVVGGSVRIDLLALVLGIPQDSLLEELNWLEKSGALRRNDGVVQLRSDAVRSALIEGLSIHARRALHRTWFAILLSQENEDSNRLAEQAYLGRLWSHAALYYLPLARQANRQGMISLALPYYEKLKRSLRQMNQRLAVEDEVAFAECLARTGRRKRAERIYGQLLEDSILRGNEQLRLFVLSKYAQLDRAPLTKRVAILQQAIQISEAAFLPSVKIYAQLCTACVAVGDLRSADEALQRAKQLLLTPGATNDATYVSAAEGFVLMSSGRFGSALQLFQGLRCDKPSMAAAVYTNVAVCLEHLGQIKKAVVVQERARQIASKAGHLWGNVSCLINLGVFRAKLGDFRRARALFSDARQLMRRCQTGEHGVVNGIEAQEACLEMMEGRYEAASHCLRQGLRFPGLFRSERQALRLLECELSLLQGVFPSKRTGFSSLDDSSSDECPLFSIQHRLLLSRFELRAVDSMKLLLRTLSDAKREELLYEVCRVAMECASRSVKAGALTDAQSYAQEALKISKKNGYKPLHAQALMLRGMASEHKKEQEHWFLLSLKLATEIGMPELIAETAYRMGALLLKDGRTASAKEYLLKSTSVISGLAEQVPVRHRAKYLAKAWRKDARKRLEECAPDRLISPPRLDALATLSEREHQYFQSLYRTSTAAATARTPQSFVSELLHVLNSSVRRPAVVMVKTDDRIAWHSVHSSLSEDLKKRVLTMAEKAKGHPYFDYRDRTLTRGAIAWIPFQSAQFTGGMYVSSGKSESLGEREMEFLTILGSLTSHAFDQILVRPPLERPAPEAVALYGIVGRSRAIRDLCSQIETIAGNTATVLIQGETGTGKELVARAIHKLSPRTNLPFIAVDCGAIPDGLIESELFGSKKGAYTGATMDRPGLFEAAHRGTLFLDEISNTNPGVQAKLLRVLQEREVRRVGETRGRPVDVRLIAATNKSLRALVEDGRFRQDLLYRLNVLELNVPPLRNRREDIPVLASHFLDRLNSAHRANKVFTHSALESLQAYDFPGNVRELQNAVERSFFTAKGKTISVAALHVTPPAPSSEEVQAWFKDLSEGRKNFWTAIHDRYKQRDISREKVIALVDLGLRATRGSYKSLAALFHVSDGEYRRLMDFLRRNKCLLDFRPYRKASAAQ